MDPEEFRTVRQHVPTRCADGTIKWTCVELNGWIFDEIERLGGTISFEPGRYEYPRIQWNSLRSTYLHRFVYGLAHPGTITPKGDIIHHANENKLDATVENLMLLDKRTHDKFHQQKRTARKFSRKSARTSERRPPSKNRALTISLDALVAETSARRDQPAGANQRSHGQLVYDLVKSANVALAALLCSLRPQLPWMYANGALRVNFSLDPRWDTGKTWRLGLKKPRLRLTRAEEALVLLMVGLGWDMAEIAKRIGTPTEVIFKISKSTAVANAVEQLRRSGASKM